MIPDFLLVNLTSWLIQVLLIATAGALLPLLFRIRHPKSQLAYCHAVLILCLVLPFIQPWQESLAIMTEHALAAGTSGATISWQTVVLWIMAAGVVAKLGWLAI